MTQKTHIPQSNRTNVHNPKSEYPFKKTNTRSQLESRITIRIPIRNSNERSFTPLTLLDPSNSLRGVCLPRPRVCMPAGSYVGPREASFVRKLAQDQVKGGESDDSWGDQGLVGLDESWPKETGQTIPGEPQSRSPGHKLGRSGRGHPRPFNFITDVGEREGWSSPGKEEKDGQKVNGST